MKVKKYTAPTMPEAMKKVRHELGVDAVILDSKIIYLGGFLGFFKKRNIQVIAALDPQNPSVKRQEVSLKEIKSANPSSLSGAGHSSQDVLSEIKEMKRWLESNPNAKTPAYSMSVQSLYAHLLEKEIKQEYIKSWLDEISINITAGNRELTKKEVVQQFVKKLDENLNEYDFSGIDYQKKYIHLAGPTGVGKTTTIAKLAANSMLRDHKKVALITTDTYRIAAIDQLKTYAKILDIPLEVAYTKADYEKARDQFRDYDLVLIDTAGRNFRNHQYVEDFEELVNLDEDGEMYLVLSLTSKYKDQEAIYKQFKSLPIKQFIFTKEDETSSYGSVINLMLLSGKGAAYITNGQEVPDNISELSVEKIIQLIVGDYAND